MVGQTGHDLTVDWWALGILIYEMVVGVTPFYNKNRQVLTSKIKHSKVVWPDRVHYKINYTDELQDIVHLLLTKDKNKRIGATNGVAEILAHPWFSDLDQDALLNYKVTPPFMPAKDEKGDYKEFFNIKDGAKDLLDSIIPQESLKAIRKNKDAFQGFSSGPV